MQDCLNSYFSWSQNICSSPSLSGKSPLCCAVPFTFYKAIETAHNTTEQKQGWEGIEEATETDSPARPSAHTLLTDAHMYISVDGRTSVAPCHSRVSDAYRGPGRPQ